MAFPQSSFKASVESHENISCYLVSKQQDTRQSQRNRAARCVIVLAKSGRLEL